MVRRGAMRHHLSTWDRIYAMHARAYEICVEVQRTRWQAAQMRQHARLTRLARYMPGANSLTLALTAAVLRQRRLLTDLAPIRRPCAIPVPASPSPDSRRVDSKPL
jgi:hypothetical protein